jgi:hypothetical protein
MCNIWKSEKITKCVRGYWPIGDVADSTWYLDASSGWIRMGSINICSNKRRVESNAMIRVLELSHFGIVIARIVMKKLDGKFIGGLKKGYKDYNERQVNNTWNKDIIKPVVLI